MCKGPKYRVPLSLDFKTWRGEIAGSLYEFCNRWCKREHFKYNALNSWKLNSCKIIDERLSFYCNNLDLLHLIISQYVNSNKHPVPVPPSSRLITMNNSTRA